MQHLQMCYCFDDSGIWALVLPIMRYKLLTYLLN